MKHNLLRRMGAILMTVAMVLSLVACGKTTFDASGYVTAYLKATTTGETTDLEGYSKEAVTKVNNDYTTQIQDALENITSDQDLSEEVQKEYTSLIKSMLGAISYKVGKATETTEGSASGYEVPVTVKPLKLNITDKLTEWAETAMGDASNIENWDTFYEKLYKEAAALLKDAVAAGQYGEETTIKLTATQNKDGLYTIDQEGLNKMAENLFITDNESLNQMIKNTLSNNLSELS